MVDIIIIVCVIGQTSFDFLRIRTLALLQPCVITCSVASQLPSSVTILFSFPGGGWWALPSNARLYFEDEYDNKRIGSWCAVDRSPQWLKIDLGQTKTITGIATQG